MWYTSDSGSSSSREAFLQIWPIEKEPEKVERLNHISEKSDVIRIFFQVFFKANRIWVPPNWYKRSSKIYIIFKKCHVRLSLDPASRVWPDSAFFELPLSGRIPKDHYPAQPCRIQQKSISMSQVPTSKCSCKVGLMKKILPTRMRRHRAAIPHSQPPRLVRSRLRPSISQSIRQSVS